MYTSMYTGIYTLHIYTHMRRPNPSLIHVHMYMHIIHINTSPYSFNMSLHGAGCCV